MAGGPEFRHHMIKEIFEQPRGLQDTLTPRVSQGIVRLEETGLTPERVCAFSASTSSRQEPAVMPGWQDST